jgi:hypothetical protein
MLWLHDSLIVLFTNIYYWWPWWLAKYRYVCFFYIDYLVLETNIVECDSIIIMGTTLIRLEGKTILVFKIMAKMFKITLLSSFTWLNKTFICYGSI